MGNGESCSPFFLGMKGEGDEGKWEKKGEHSFALYDG